MEDGKKSRGEKALVAGILILGVLILAAAAYLWLFIMNKPVMVLTAPSVTVEAGDTFDEWTMVKSLEHVRDEQVTIDRENLDTNTPGEYEVVYTLKGLTGEESLPVSVKVVDTVPPVLKVTEEVYEGQPGDVVNINQFVVDASDRTGVTCTFEDGSTEKALDEGSYELGIVARDGAGNESRASVSVQVIVPDQEAPVIGGAVNTAVKLGESFDVMSGISVSDDKDPSPSVTADVSSIDTGTLGATVIHYSAVDNMGKTSEAERIVTVANDVIEHDGARYGVYWDLTGVAGQPYLVAVNRTMNTVTVYGLDESGRYTNPVAAFVCSTGPNTPEGYFRTLERSRGLYRFEDCWGQYATRIIGHILFHSVPYFTQNQANLEFDEYNLLGTPASLGCIRLCVADVKWIYDNCPTGFPCVIYDDSVTAGPLGKPVPITIDTADERRGWDPTDPDPANPWNM